MKSKSILTDDLEKCYICESHSWLEQHHIFGGANRKKSTKYKLTVPLCHGCHNEPPGGVHHNRKNNDKLKELGQKAFEQHYPNLNFLQLFGRNYL